MHELISTTSGLILYKYLISFVLLGAISTVALIVWYVVRRSFYEVYGDELETITQERSRTQVKKKRRAKSRKKELPDGISGKVVHVIDGDTVDVELGRAMELLMHKQVKLESGREDRGPRKDVFDRYLAYLMISGKKDYGLIMIREGHGECFGWKYPHPRQDAYEAAQKKAPNRLKQKRSWVSRSRTKG